MSKILTVALAIVGVTGTIEPRMFGTMIRKKSWLSVAPSRRAASMISVETPLIAAERTTIAKPVWSQIRITISAKMLIGFVVKNGIAWPPNPVITAFSSPIWGWPAGSHAYMKPQMTDAP